MMDSIFLKLEDRHIDVAFAAKTFEIGLTNHPQTPEVDVVVLSPNEIRIAVNVAGGGNVSFEGQVSGFRVSLTLAPEDDGYRLEYEVLEGHFISKFI